MFGPRQKILRGYNSQIKTALRSTLKEKSYPSSTSYHGVSDKTHQNTRSSDPVLNLLRYVASEDEDILQVIKHKYLMQIVEYTFRPSPTADDPFGYDLLYYINIAKTLMEKLRGVKSQRILLSKNPSTSFRNKVQILAEETLGCEIEWWPFAEPHRISGVPIRVAWSNQCGVQHTEHVPDHIAEILMKLLDTIEGTSRREELVKTSLLLMMVLLPFWTFLAIETIVISMITGSPVLGLEMALKTCSSFVFGMSINHLWIYPPRRIHWTKSIINFLEVQEAVVTILLEHIGTTFWIDVTCWIQVPGLCPSLQHVEGTLRYKATVAAASSNNAAAAQAQQTTSPLNAQNIQSPLTQVSSNSQGALIPPAGLNQGHLATNQASGPGSSQHQSVPLERHVFITSKVGGHYLLSQWNTLIPRPQDDREFFRKLRKCYISVRGFWRYHFGLRVFSHCDFYRLKKHGPSTFSISTEELPECDDCRIPNRFCAVHRAYYYEPKPAKRRPPLEPEDFRMQFYACHHRRAAHTSDGIGADTYPLALMKLCV